MPKNIFLKCAIREVSSVINKLRDIFSMKVLGLEALVYPFIEESIVGLDSDTFSRRLSKVVGMSLVYHSVRLKKF